MDFLYPLVEGFGSSHDCLDSASVLNATRSDWVLVYASSKVSVLRQKDLRKEWTFNSPPIRRCDLALPTLSVRSAIHVPMLVVCSLPKLIFTPVNHCCGKAEEQKEKKSSKVLKVTNSSISCSQPAPGHFHDSGVLDLFIQHSADGVMQVS